MPSWNPDLYLRFEKERTRPSLDLAARVPLEKVDSILDVGCGPGNSTAVIAARYPGASVLGIDSSAEMIAKARADHPAFGFRQFDISGDLAPLGSFDVVFSNACLQWLPGHETLLPRLMGLVSEGGALAVQIPVNQEQPIYHIVQQAALQARFRVFAEKENRSTHRLAPAQYYDVLAACARDIQLWQTTYYHEMESHEAILEWYRGTALRPYLEALPAGLRDPFVQAVRQGIQAQYPVSANGRALFPFPRLFFTATK